MNDPKNENLLLENLKGEQTDQVPFWFMRQAGRYLPEYRELRKQAGGFLDLVYDPEKASEVTLQPIRRFGMNGAILFSDILVIPQSLGQDLRFETGEGPKLQALKEPQDIEKLTASDIDQTLSPIYETVSRVRQKLQVEGFHQTNLIGFAGAPWTVACYMIEGGGSKNFEKTKNWAANDPESFGKLIETISEATIHYLSKQVEAGAEALQLFDSWAGLLEGDDFDRWVMTSTAKIVKALKEKHPGTPVIGFPREAGEKTASYAQKTAIDAIGLDYSLSPVWARDNLQATLPVQGNLDPSILLEGGEKMEKAAMNIIEIFSDKPFIFNLGHGVIKETPVEHVEQLSQIIRDFRS